MGATGYCHSGPPVLRKRASSTRAWEPLDLSRSSGVALCGVGVHVVAAGLDPDRVVHDPVHDRVGVDAFPKSTTPASNSPQQTDRSISYYSASTPARTRHSLRYRTSHHYWSARRKGGAPGVEPHWNNQSRQLAPNKHLNVTDRSNAAQAPYPRFAAVFHDPALQGSRSLSISLAGRQKNKLF